MSVRKKKPGKSALPVDVNAAIRARQALELILAGCDYTTAAQRVGYSGRSACWTAVHRELARSLKPPTEELRQLEVMRLDRWLAVADAQVMKGSLWALDRCLKISEARRKLLGLEIAPLAHPGDQQQAQMIVIGIPAEVADAV